MSVLAYDDVDLEEVKGKLESDDYGNHSEDDVEALFEGDYTPPSDVEQGTLLKDIGDAALECCYEKKVDRIAGELELPDETRLLARETARYSGINTDLANHETDTVAGAAVYFSTVWTNNLRTQGEISETYGGSRVSLRETFHKLSEHIGEETPHGMLPEEVIERSRPV
ncbi:hypothetical protein [Candidatus Nanohalococcus occultus]|uniref:hypothetical protein n=1 Tax=Candidatus Nanohalococcus occultus TaxID=2978047 RepID=UPI0039E00D45